MDTQDYNRYKRLAANSDLDFLKYFLLTMLREMRILQLMDYKMLCPPLEILEMLEAIEYNRLLKNTKRYEDIVFTGYRRYLEYISAKEGVLESIGSPSDIETYNKEQVAAENDLYAMNRGLFCEEERRSYLRRLSTKLLTAQVVCVKIKGTVFDSREYQRGVTLLKKVGLFSENILFDNKLYNRSKAFDKLISITKDNRDLRLFLDEHLSKPVFLDFWLPFVFLKSLSKQNRECISSLGEELQKKSRLELKEEIYEWLLANQKEVGVKEKNHIYKNTTDQIISVVPVVGQLYSVYNLFKLLSSVNNLRKTNISSVAQLIGIALLTEIGTSEINRKECMNKWIVWISNIFKSSVRDSNWISSQREMGSWTKADLYVPWFEHSQDKLKQLRLI